MAAAPAAAQELPEGVRLSVTYEVEYRPKLAIRTFTGDGDMAAVAQQIREIIHRDLDFSDRFDMVDVPPSLDAGPVDYDPWLDLGIDLLLVGHVEPWSDGYLLRLTLHDVVYRRVNQIRAFAIPPVGNGEYRMSVHAVSDEVVFWATGQPGMAASRIAFRRSTPDGGLEFVTVDSDGENLTRLLSAPEHVLRSVAWAPDGTRIAYTVQDAVHGGMAIYERELATGAVRVLVDRPSVTLYTPAYSPDGRRLAFAMSRGSTVAELYDMDVVQRCCVRQLRATPGRMIEMFPSYSPDGRQLVFMSDRIGQAHIYVMPAEGGTPVLLTRYVPGQRVNFVEPKWSPTDSRIVFIEENSAQLLIADASRPGAEIRQITLEGRSEQPTWAPDGRHIAFSGIRNGVPGVYVIDTVTKRVRPLHVGVRDALPSWSPTLKRASSLTTGGS